MKESVWKVSSDSSKFAVFSDYTQTLRGTSY